jgi:hypothetical protein
MKAPLQAPVQEDQARQFDAVQRAPDRQTTWDVGFVDNRPAAVAQRKLQEMINNSPRVLQQKAIRNSPRMMAQRQQREALFGGAVQQQEDEASHDRLQTAQAMEEPLQAKFPSQAPAQLAQAPVVKGNNTGLPDQLKSGIESMSGRSIDHVKVHYNSPRPAQMQALAYAQGSAIHIGPGQEKHLPHEAWHVVQQAQGRVKPTMQMKHGVAVNDDKALEHEADVMGQKAMQRRVIGTASECPSRQAAQPAAAPSYVQRMAGSPVVQLKTINEIKLEMGAGSILSNFAQGFIVNHIGSGNNTNMEAAKIHATRPAPPPVNTVIVDARELKTKLIAGAWTDPGNGYFDVTTHGNTDRQNTTRRGAAIAAPPAKSAKLAFGGTGDDADKFTVANGAVTAITGVSPAELNDAVTACGPYPPNSNKKKERREYRGALVKRVNDQRTATDGAVGANWIQANFSHIGATAIDATYTSEALVNGIAPANQAVRVYISINTGNIYHLHA